MKQQQEINEQELDFKPIKVKAYYLNSNWTVSKQLKKLLSFLFNGVVK